MTGPQTQAGPLALTVETTADRYALVVSRGEAVLAACDALSNRKLDCEIFTALERVLSEAEVSLEQLDRLIVGRGPGSFVGTRIGLAVANSLAMVRAIPVVGVDAFEPLAVLGRARGWGDFLAAVNCVREEVFYRDYGPGGDREAVTVARFDDFRAIAAGCPVVFRVTEMNRTLERARVAGLPGVMIPDFPEIVRAMTALGLEAQLAGETAEPPLPQPLYVKSEGARTWQP